MGMNKEAILNALNAINAPGTGTGLNQSGSIKNVQIFGDQIDIDLISTNPALNVRKKLESDVVSTLKEKFGDQLDVRVKIETVKAEPQEIKGKPLANVQNIIAVASGKGGVGKSTITANIAVALAEMGFSVGLVDADIYGPSMPIMFDVVGARPSSVSKDGKSMIEPIESYGVKMLSIGFFAGTDQAVVWRGPMASKALNQMIFDADWGMLDFLLIDLPPGTGDIHLSLVQALPVTGSVIVSTPQAVALADARKGVGMFSMDAINVPVVGIVENMSYFTPAELPENKYYIFGREGAKLLAEDLKVPFLGEIPLVQSIRESGDVGRPAYLQGEGPVYESFKNMTKEVVKQVVYRNEHLSPTRKVEITTMAGCSAVN